MMAGAHVITMGCRLNAHDSEIIRQNARRAGMDDAVIVNTCAVTGEAVRQARQTVRRARRDNPASRIVVTGCAAQIEPENFAAMAEVDLVLGNEEKLRAESYGLEAGGKVRVADIMDVTDAAAPVVEGFAGRARAFVQIQTGCDHRCTFCIIPFGRGNSRSVPVAQIVEQTKRLVDAGHAEIVLTGVDITSWGANFKTPAMLGELVQTLLADVPGLKRLRLSSIDSIEVDAALLDAIAGDERLMPHLHLSVQSGDDMILKRMKRRHSRDDTLAFCAEVRKRRPDIVFGADIIAGFPTETEEMFASSLSLVEAAPLTYLHVFPYSPRPGTPAARMPQVDGAVIRKRAQRLRLLGAQQLEGYLRGLNGERLELLVETGRTGRSAHYAQAELDRDAAPGSIVPFDVSGTDGRLLQGRVAA